MRDSTEVRKTRYSFAGLLGALLLLLTAFPYLQLMPSDSYTQPYGLLLGALLFFMHGWPVLFRLALTDQIALIGLAILGIAIFLVTCFPYTDPQEYKYLISYLSPLLLTIPLFRYLRHDPTIALRLLQFSILLWIVVAIIQKFIDPNFFLFLIGQWSDSAPDIVQSGRGVLSLAPEPTHHALHILLLASCLVLLDTSGHSRWVLLFCIVDAVLLAASASAILVLGISGVVWLLCYRRRWLVVAAVFVAIGWLGGFIDHVPTSNDHRVGQLISAVLADPPSLLTVDYSMNMRLGGMIAVVSEAFGNALVPYGMSLQAWETARDGLLTDLPWLMDLSLVGPPSGIGVLLFQAGLFGAILIGLVFRRILSPSVGMLGRILLIACPIIFLGQYYISAPTFSLLYACALFRLGHKPARIMTKSNSSRTLVSAQLCPSR